MLNGDSPPASGRASKAMVESVSVLLALGVAIM
jgi:hypothetical protein